MPRTALASAALLSVLALGACSGRTAGANSSTATTDAANTAEPAVAAAATTPANAPLYPDWAQAVVPPYPNVTLGILVNQGEYQFQSTDDLATVAGWYKSRVNAAWSADATSGNWSATVNGVKISIYKNPVTTGDAANVKTMIAISHA